MLPEHHTWGSCAPRARELANPYEHDVSIVNNGNCLGCSLLWQAAALPWPHGRVEGADRWASSSRLQPWPCRFLRSHLLARAPQLQPPDKGPILPCLHPPGSQQLPVPPRCHPGTAAGAGSCRRVGGLEPLSPRQDLPRPPCAASAWEEVGARRDAAPAALAPRYLLLSLPQTGGDKAGEEQNHISLPETEPSGINQPLRVMEGWGTGVVGTRGDSHGTHVQRSAPVPPSRRLREL